ncbi:phage tail protein [Niallia sp. MER 6]|uniref:phage tail protein n=1 Tax=Niallia sp. MER 6 TaxID=2939567 RepID=UPI00203F23CB|nr:phage tail protein [Niallia sp. MER 6]MCM3032834.1 phage tail protein [Niallia sp. MER 6]
MILKVLNSDRKLVAYLENAYEVSYEKKLNEIPLASFSLPLDDPKVAECKPLYYVDIPNHGLFRIMPSSTLRNETDKKITFNLEHVLATLLDDVLFQYHQTTNRTTRYNIEYILSQQSTTHWKLGTCAFDKYFAYKWENENGLLGAINSIAEPFDENYEWTYDTSSYPWTLNLIKPSSTPTCEIRYAKNLVENKRDEDPTDITNRIYALGYGEGVNQLKIDKVNSGKPYVEDTTSIATYGLKAYVYADTSIEDAATLLANAKALLKQSSVPKVSYSVTAADLSALTGVSIDEFKCGKVVRIVDPDFGTFEQRIVSESRSDIKGALEDVSLEIANKYEDIAGSIAGLERSRQINEVYSQGATNIDSHNFADNADSDNPAEITIYLPDELVRINKLVMSYKTDKFRAYERSIKGGGAIVDTTSSGGGSTQTSSSGGQSTQTSSSGGGVSTSTESGGGTVQSTSTKSFAQLNLTSQVPQNAIGGSAEGYPDYGFHLHEVQIPGDYFEHSHSVTVPAHTHNFSVPAHTHSVSVPAHTHNVTIPAHTHELTLPNHTHDIEFGIFELDESATSVQIVVDGNTVPFTATSGNLIDLIPYLDIDSNGKVNRGWHTIQIKPNKLARITAQVFSQVFLQSRGGGDY